MVPHPEQPVQPQPPPPAQLWQGICSVYDAAQASGAANRTDTSVVLEPDGGIDFVLRVAAALRAKPRAAAPTGNKPRNPFLPYEEALWVAHLSATHTLLLNKFNVVRHHVLVVTRQFESQTDPLNAADLAAAQQVLEAMPTGGVAFYNCGEHSGRSQPHKHLQARLHHAHVHAHTCTQRETDMRIAVVGCRD
jgi:sulfate adenylyltransferase (ADP) / ATP adenylyltransferase